MPRRTFPLTAMCLLQLSPHVTLSTNTLAQLWYSAHACLLSALLFRATRSTLPFSGNLITLSVYLCCSGPSASLQNQPCSNMFKPVLPTQTPQLDSRERLQPDGHCQCAKLYNIASFKLAWTMVSALIDGERSLRETVKSSVRDVRHSATHTDLTHPCTWKDSHLQNLADISCILLLHPSRGGVEWGGRRF